MNPSHRSWSIALSLFGAACSSGSPGGSEHATTGHSHSGLHECPMPPGPFPAGAPGSGSLLVGPAWEQPNTNSDIGAFRVTCAYSHMNYDDPLVFPGQPGAAHLHMYFGNTGTNAYSTAESLRTTGNSTCHGGIANRSAYWIPTLLQDGQPLLPGSAIFYYKAGYEISGVSPRIQRIPAGLRMIAGNAATTELQTDNRAHWGCENNYIGHYPQIVDCNVGDSIQLEVFFPQCWDGMNLDAPDHKSHMSYAVEGDCPASHPVVLPEISLNIRWLRTENMNIAALRLSSDCISELPGGYSAHGDWMEAWEPEIRDTFVTRCINPTFDCHANLLGDGRELYEP